MTTHRLWRGHIPRHSRHIRMTHWQLLSFVSIFERCFLSRHLTSHVLLEWDLNPGPFVYWSSVMHILPCYPATCRL